MSDLEDLTITELKDLAKKNNIKNISKLKKEELITVLKQVIGDTVSIDDLSSTENEQNVNNTNN